MAVSMRRDCARAPIRRRVHAQRPVQRASGAETHGRTEVAAARGPRRRCAIRVVGEAPAARRVATAKRKRWALHHAREKTAV